MFLKWPNKPAILLKRDSNVGLRTHFLQYTSSECFSLQNKSKETNRQSKKICSTNILLKQNNVRKQKCIIIKFNEGVFRS